MDSRTYVLSAHPGCIEANYVERRGSEINLLTRLDSQFFLIKESGTAAEATVLQKFDKNLKNYIDSHPLKDTKVLFVLPSEEITFRTLSFPFQDIRKIKQVLPFELGNEILGNLEDYHYTYQIKLVDEGQAKTLIQLVSKEKRDYLIDFCAKKSWELQGIFSSASLLAGLIPHDWKIGKCFQVYVGVDECFVSVLYEGDLLTVKSFPNRIFDVVENHYRQSEEQNAIELREKLADNTENLRPIKNELVWLCSQINLFLMSNVEDYSNISISFHGVFASLFNWQNQRVSLKTNHIDQQILEGDNSQSSMKQFQTSESVESNLIDGKQSLAMVDSKIRIRGTDEPSDRNPWGILGDMPKRFPDFFDRHPLSHFSQGTATQRFVKQNKLGLAAVILLSIIFLGSLGGNSFLQIKTKQQLIAHSDHQLQQQILQILPNSNLQADQAISHLNNLIAQRTQVLKLSDNFADRNYISLKFLERLTNLMEKNNKLSLERIDFSSDRFSMNGAIDSYENLQKLKSKLEIFPEFKEKRIIESNRKSQEGILYRITVDL
ncbi:MAG: hypothetical protein P8O70_14565 [SAR324 cluster bacterium]|nr:hypothetical protein [SAR324 cluster bacterium]